MICTVWPRVGALALLVQDVPVHLAGSQVGIFVQIFVDEALIMAQIQVGLGAVVGDEHLAVLQGAHGAGVNIDVGVQFLRGDLQTAGFEQTAKACRRDALAQTGNHAAGDEYVLSCHIVHPPHPVYIQIHYTLVMAGKARAEGQILYN